MANNLNYSDVEEQTSYQIIPDKTLAKVRMKLISGGYDDESRGWTGGYATKSKKTDAVYLKCEFTVIGGKYNNRKVWDLIGLHSEKGPNYEKMGRGFIRAILDSAHGLNPKDITQAAVNARIIKSFQELDGIEFVAQIDVQQDQDGNDRNTIRYAITKGHRDYDSLMIGGKVGNNGRYKIGKSKQFQEPEIDIEDDELPF